MPTYGLLLFYKVDRTASYFMKPELKNVLVIMTFIFTFVMPLIVSLLLLRARYIRSLGMETREERRLPLLFTALFYVSEYWLLYNRAVPETLKLLILSATLSVILTVIVNLFWKISAHMVGIGGLTGAMFVLSFFSRYHSSVFLMTLLLLAAGIIGVSRLVLESHKPAEIYTGYLLGFVCPLIFLL